MANSKIKQWLSTQEAKDAGYTAEFIEKLNDSAIETLKDEKLRAWLQKGGGWI